MKQELKQQVCNFKNVMCSTLKMQMRDVYTKQVKNIKFKAF